MAGHSKWANIQHRKTRQDEKRGKVWTRLIKEITIATRISGGEPNSNPRLRLAIDKACHANMPKNNVMRAIQRGIKILDNNIQYEKVRYGGYGINGTAIIVDCLTDNRIRTIANLRYIFSQFDGNITTEDSVTFMFKQYGQLLYPADTNENMIIEVALEMGVEDIISHHEGTIEVLTLPNQFSIVKINLEKLGFKAKIAKIIMKPITEIVLIDDEAIRMQKLLNTLENLDDVHEVYSNVIITI